MSMTGEGEIVQPSPIIIRANPGWVPLNLHDLWEYRELLYFLAWRDVKVRYKQTALGVTWAVLQPLMLMAVFSIVLGGLAKVPSEGFPYPIFTYCALLPWQLFAHGLAQASNSLVVNEKLITKVYFPRLLIPFSAILSGLIDFFIAFVILLAMIIYYGLAPSGALWSVPFFVLLAVVSALAVSLWLSALNVQYRDVRYMIPFITQFWLLASPVAYSSNLVPEPWRWLYALNPMAGVIEGFRWALLGNRQGPGAEMVVSVTAVLLLFVGGLYYFRRMEKTFADVV